MQLDLFSYDFTLQDQQVNLADMLQEHQQK
jgi:hypothetical protein